MDIQSNHNNPKPGGKFPLATNTDDTSISTLIVPHAHDYLLHNFHLPWNSLHICAQEALKTVLTIHADSTYLIRILPWSSENRGLTNL